MNNTMMMLYLFIMLNEFLGARIKRMRVTLTPALQPVIAMLEHNAPSIVELAWRWLCAFSSRAAKLPLIEGTQLILPRGYYFHLSFVSEVISI